MRPLTILRTSGAVWFLPLLFAVGVWVAVSNTWELSGYSVADLAVASILLKFVGPLTASYVAFRFPSFLRTMATARPVRTRSWVLVVCWSGILLGAPAAAVLAMISAARIVPDEPLAGAVVLLAVVAVLACAGFGALCARALPSALAIPSAAVGTFVWFSYPDVGTQVLLRNLDSNYAGCCANTTRPAVGFLLGSGVLDLVVILGAWLMVTGTRAARRNRPVAALALVGVVAMAFGLGAAAAVAPGKLDFNGVEPRTTSLVCSGGAGYRLCVWPEHRNEAVRVLGELRRFDGVVAQAGLASVRTAGEDPQHPGPGIVVYLSPHATVSELIDSFAGGYVGRATTCGGRVEPRQPVVPQLVVDLLAGVSPSAVGWDPTSVRQAEQVLHEDRASLARWFDEHTCALPSVSTP